MKTEAQIIDLKSAKDRFEGDKDFYLELADTFIAELPDRITRMQEAEQARDAGEVSTIAHQIKGALLNLSAEAAAAVALRIETAARGNDLATCDAELGLLLSEVNKYRARVEDVRTKNIWEEG